ncbi:MAG: hypothetical protein E6826_06035 [Anaerococcus vaginalis]|nr:hypothetical protein [Anaerococcus vaginalis]
MKCDRCDNEANVTVKAIINGIEHDFHLCNDCMEKLSKGEGNFLFDGNEKDIDMKIENDYFPSTIFTTEKTLFTLSPSTKATGKDSSTYIILMRKPMESSNSYVYVIGAFENGSTIKNYYLRINDGKMKKIDRYEEVELVEGTNKIELSKDGVNILKRIVVERDK